jgi:hypothetical protein
MNKSTTLLIFVFTMLAACQPIMLTATSSQAKSVLTDVLQKTDSCKSRDRLEPTITSEQANGHNIYSFTCNNSADTNYIVSITFFDNKATAHTQLEMAQNDNPVKCFHGYDLYETISGASANNSFIVEEKLGWQAKAWVITIFASYDYRYFHYNAIDFSEAVYTSGVVHSLFPSGACPITSTVSP